jgi:hypothetical protein
MFSGKDNKDIAVQEVLPANWVNITQNKQQFCNIFSAQPKWARK